MQSLLDDDNMRHYKITAKATVGDCNHAFCRDCITHTTRSNKQKQTLYGLSENNVNHVQLSYTVDNFIMDIRETSGGTMNE